MKIFEKHIYESKSYNFVLYYYFRWNLWIKFEVENIMELSTIWQILCKCLLIKEMNIYKIIYYILHMIVLYEYIEICFAFVIHEEHEQLNLKELIIYMKYKYVRVLKIY